MIIRNFVYVGENHDDYTVIEIYGGYCIVECNICKHKRKLKTGDFRRCRNFHSVKTCKEDYFKTNQLEGDYEFLCGSDNISLSNKKLYKIRCKTCGNIKYLPIDNIQRCVYFHNAKNCGEKVYDEKIGLTIDDVQIISYIGKANSKNKSSLFLCKCNKCGRIKQMAYSNIYNHKGTNHKYCSLIINNKGYIDEFRSRWANMRDRTTNPNNEKYPIYGGRGIKSDEFILFVDFYDCMYQSFIEHVEQYGVHNTTLERIDVNLDYTKDNITWATWEEQANNKQDTVYFKVIFPDGSEKIEYGIGKCEKEHNLTHNFIYNRVYGIVESDYKGVRYELIGSNRIQNEEVINK